MTYDQMLIPDWARGTDGPLYLDGERYDVEYGAPELDGRPRRCTVCGGTAEVWCSVWRSGRRLVAVVHEGCLAQVQVPEARVLTPIEADEGEG